jgi:hypothetical protein
VCGRHPHRRRCVSATSYILHVQWRPGRLERVEQHNRRTGELEDSQPRAAGVHSTRRQDGQLPHRRDHRGLGSGRPRVG